MSSSGNNNGRDPPVIPTIDLGVLLGADYRSRCRMPSFLHSAPNVARMPENQHDENNGREDDSGANEPEQATRNIGNLKDPSKYDDVAPEPSLDSPGGDSNSNPSDGNEASATDSPSQNQQQQDSADGDLSEHDELALEALKVLVDGQAMPDYSTTNDENLPQEAAGDKESTVLEKTPSTLEDTDDDSSEYDDLTLEEMKRLVNSQASPAFKPKQAISNDSSPVKEARCTNETASALTPMKDTVCAVNAIRTPELTAPATANVNMNTPGNKPRQDETTLNSASKHISAGVASFECISGSALSTIASLQASTSAAASIKTTPMAPSAEKKHMPSRKRKRIVDTRVATMAEDIAPNTLNRCVPLAEIPSDFVRVTEEGKNEADIPDFDFLVNFPRIGRAQRGHDERLCVMCGNTRPFVKSRPEGDGSTPYILRNVKGVCSSCEVTVWVTSRGVRVKFCDQCSNFRPLQCFAAKDPGKSRNGIVNSCLDCRATKNGPRNNKKDNESNSPQKKKRAAKPTEPQKPRSVIAPVSLHRCIPVSALSDIDHSSSLAEPTMTELADSSLLVNFPSHLGKAKQGAVSKYCAQCGVLRPLLKRRGDSDGSAAFIQYNRPAICSSCQETIWEIAGVNGNLYIKWCPRGHHFCHLSAFKRKKVGTSEKLLKYCTPCRILQADHDAKYRAKKKSVSQAGQDSIS